MVGATKNIARVPTQVTPYHILNNKIMFRF